MIRALIDFLIDFFHRMFAELKAARLRLSPSLDAVLASASREIDRLEQVATARTEESVRLIDKAGAAMQKAEATYRALVERSDNLWDESERAQRIAKRFRELLD